MNRTKRFLGAAELAGYMRVTEDDLSISYCEQKDLIGDDQRIDSLHLDFKTLNSFDEEHSRGWGSRCLAASWRRVSHLFQTSASRATVEITKNAGKWARQHKETK